MRMSAIFVDMARKQMYILPKMSNYSQVASFSVEDSLAHYFRYPNRSFTLLNEISASAKTKERKTNMLWVEEMK